MLGTITVHQWRYHERLQNCVDEVRSDGKQLYIRWWNRESERYELAVFAFPLGFEYVRDFWNS